MELVRYDVALSNLQGPYGEDGRLQGLLDYLRVPYCGSGVGASAVAADHITATQLALTQLPNELVRDSGWACSTVMRSDECPCRSRSHCSTRPGSAPGRGFLGGVIAWPGWSRLRPR